MVSSSASAGDALLIFSGLFSYSQEPRVLAERDGGSRLGIFVLDMGEEDKEMRGNERKEKQAQSLFRLAAPALGILLALATAVMASTQQFSVLGATSTAFAGIILGIVGYFLGARRLGTAAAFLSIVALILGLAVSQGLVPGLERTDPVENQQRG